MNILYITKCFENLSSVIDAEVGSIMTSIFPLMEYNVQIII